MNPSRLGEIVFVQQAPLVGQQAAGPGLSPLQNLFDLRPGDGQLIDVRAQPLRESASIASVASAHGDCVRGGLYLLDCCTFGRFQAGSAIEAW